MGKRFLLLCVLLASNSFADTIYKYKEDGRTIYTNIPQPGAQILNDDRLSIIHSDGSPPNDAPVRIIRLEKPAGIDTTQPRVQIDIEEIRKQCELDRRSDCNDNQALTQGGNKSHPGKSISITR